MTERCSTCKAWKHAASHKCPPCWFCTEEEGPIEDDDWTEVYAYDAEDAAEKYAEESENNSAEYYVAEGKTTMNVRVRASHLDEPERVFAVSGEFRPHYHACEVIHPDKTGGHTP